MPRIKVGVIGSGNIGIDLCERLLRDERFELFFLIGRRPDSEGLIRFKGKIPFVESEGIRSLERLMNQVDGFFDATSAFDHQQHWDIAITNQKWAIDLTPSKIGQPMVPALINETRFMKLSNEKSHNYSMVTCGGQSAAPIVHAITSAMEEIEEVEISSSIASKSAGPATRRNIDQYVSTTENLMSKITGAKSAKAILVLNPIEPPVMMRTTVHVKGKNYDYAKVTENVIRLEIAVQKYLKNYTISIKPFLSENDVISSTVKVEGSGYYLPSFAGNLDIINAAAIETAYRHSLESGHNVLY